MLLYRDAVLNDMPYVAKLHEDCFSGTFIASLGQPLIANYYRAFLEEQGPFVLAFDNKELVGFCMGYYAGSSARNKFIAENKYRLVLKLLSLCVSLNKLAIKKCWLYLFPPKHLNNQITEHKEAQADLLSICVKERFRGQGVSSHLINEFENRLRTAGKGDITLSVYKTNNRAISFYQKMGYSILEDNGEEYKMYKVLQK